MVSLHVQQVVLQRITKQCKQSQPRKQAGQVNNDRSRLGRDENKRHILQRTIPQSGRPQRKEAGFDSSWTFDPDVSVARAS